MPRSMTGVVVGKDFMPPEGRSPEDWCYLVLDISDEDRMTIRLHRNKIDAASLGDRVRFRTPRGPKSKVRRVHRL